MPNAERVREFYQAVVGWTATEVEMGGYSNFCLHPSGAATPIADVCHAREMNATLPPQWLIYITVPNPDASLASCLLQGGKIVAEPCSMGGNARCAVIEDPAGAVGALYQPESLESDLSA